METEKLLTVQEKLRKAKMLLENVEVQEDGGPDFSNLVIETRNLKDQTVIVDSHLVETISQLTELHTQSAEIIKRFLLIKEDNQQTQQLVDNLFDSLDNVLRQNNKDWDSLGVIYEKVEQSIESIDKMLPTEKEVSPLEMFRILLKKEHSWIDIDSVDNPEELITYFLNKNGNDVELAIKECARVFTLVLQNILKEPKK